MKVFFLKIKYPSNFFFATNLTNVIEIWQISFKEIKILAIKKLAENEIQVFYKKIYIKHILPKTIWLPT
jgi:hypothetical protein